MEATEYKTLADGSRIPALGLGTWGMGGWQTASHEKDEAEAIAIRAAVDAGLNHIDTAEMYGAGHTEELVGEAIRGIRRKELFVTSKKWADNLNYQAILESCKASCQRLGLRYLDLYLLHFYNPAYPLDVALRAMAKLVDEGYVKRFGVSNFNLAQLRRARRYAGRKLVVNQVLYNLHDQQGTKELLDYCKKEQILVIAYTPLKRGTLATSGERTLERVAQKYRKTKAQVALRWLLDQENIVTIPKMTSPAHLEENLGALGWTLSEEDWRALAKA